MRKTSRKKRWPRLVAGAVGLVIVVLGLAAAHLYRQAHIAPAYYLEVLEMPRAQQIAASEQMMQKTTEIVSLSAQPGQWQIVFTQEEINGWLAVDLARNHADAIPEGISDPRVILEKDNAILACRVDNERYEGVISVVVDLFMTTSGRVALRLREIRAGRLGLPKAMLLDEIAREARKTDFAVQWQQRDGDPVLLIAADFENEKGDPIEIETIQITQGQVRLGGTTRTK